MTLFGLFKKQTPQIPERVSTFVEKMREHMTIDNAHHWMKLKNDLTEVYPDYVVYLNEQYYVADKELKAKEYDAHFTELLVTGELPNKIIMPLVNSSLRSNHFNIAPQVGVVDGNTRVIGL